MNKKMPFPKNFTSRRFGWKSAIPACAILAGIVGWGLPSVYAATATANMSVQLILAANCTIDSAGAMSFGSNTDLTTALAATSTILITCTSGSPYTIELSAGAGSGATTAVRKMTSGANTLNYSLYKEVAHTNVWGTGATDDVNATGTAAQQTYTVYGLVPSQTTPPPGTYTDTVAVTVTY